MTGIEPAWATRFYGMEVPAEVAAAARESLTVASIADLVDAHLAINYSYFGAIDKTLSGFVVLDDEGDNYMLHDLRDGGQVWFQDHETRELVLRFDSVADWQADKPGSTAKPSRRAVSTPDLCARYQWLVWQLARPLLKDGKPTQSTDYLVRNGIGRFRYLFPRRPALEAAFEAELPALASDPHLAIYWLLHAAALADDERRSRVVAAIGDGGPSEGDPRAKESAILTPFGPPIGHLPAGPELVRAFVDRLGSLPLAGDLPVVPAFRARRSLATTYGAFELSPDEVPAASLRALELSPATRSLHNALQVAAGIERGLLEPAQVAAAMVRITEPATGPELLRALLERGGGATSSKHADELARLLPGSDDPWWTALDGLWQVHELAYDGRAIVAATRKIVAHDRYHRRALQMLMRGAQIAGLPIEVIENELDIADGVLGPYTRLVEVPDKWEETVGSLLDPSLLRGLAWRVLQRAEVNRPAAPLAAWAAGVVLASADPTREEVVGTAFSQLDPATQGGVVQAAAEAIDRADHPLVAVLLACLDGPEPAENDYAAQFAQKSGKEAAIMALAPWFHQAPLFGKLMALLERPASPSVIDVAFGKLFNPFQKDTYVVPKLDAAQAVRVVKLLIATKLRHPSIFARNAAGHQLDRFHHAGAESFLIDSLVEYGVRYAAAKGPGGAVLDRGKTENDELEDVVANLYSAVRGLKTPASRTALAERLFAERRSYWRMGSAIGHIWDPELHAQIMAMLAERRDARAAGCYAYTLREFVKQGPPLVELTRLVLDWQGDTEVTSGFLHYALIVGIVAALDARDHELVRRAHDAASWIHDPPLEPRSNARGGTWKNPLDEPELKVQLEHVLSGKADEERRKLQEAVAAARAKGRPTLAITDDALGQLADTTVELRLLRDGKTGEIWFKDSQQRLRYFDGYEVVEAPFTARAIGHDGAAAELADVTAISERALWWDADAENFRDAVRLGDRVLFTWGANNGTLDRYVLVFATTDDAAAFMTTLRANPVKGFTESEPYYLAGKGAVVRTYYAPKPGGTDLERRMLWLLGSAVSDEDRGTAEHAVAEHLRREALWLRGGGVLSTIEWSAGRRRPQDLTVREWMVARSRDDRRDPRWHLAALAEIADYLASHGLLPPSRANALRVELGPPASADEIDAFAASRSHPVPESLRALWSVHGSALWQVGERGERLLSPAEVEKRRLVAQLAGENYLAKLPPDAAAAAAPLFGDMSLLVETLDQEPVTFLADVVREDGRVFSHASAHPNDFWWESSLAWILATRLVADFVEAVVAAAPLVATLKYGERAKAKEPLSERARTPKVKAVARPKAQATPKPRAQATQKPTAQATPKPTAKATPKPTAKATPKPTAKAAKPKAKAIPKPKAKAIPKPKAKAARPKVEAPAKRKAAVAKPKARTSAKSVTPTPKKKVTRGAGKRAQKPRANRRKPSSR